MWQVLTLKEIIDIYWVLAIWQTVFTYILLPTFYKIASELMLMSLAFHKRKLVTVKLQNSGRPRTQAHRPSYPRCGEGLLKIQVQSELESELRDSWDNSARCHLQTQGKGRGEGTPWRQISCPTETGPGFSPQDPQINIYIITHNFYSQKGGSTLKLCVVFVSAFFFNTLEISHLVLSYLDTGQLRQGSYCDSIWSKNLGFSHCAVVG